MQPWVGCHHADVNTVMIIINLQEDYIVGMDILYLQTHLVCTVH